MWVDEAPVLDIMRKGNILLNFLMEFHFLRNPTSGQNSSNRFQIKQEEKNMMPQASYAAPEGTMFEGLRDKLDHHSSISIIIPAYNEEKNIGNILFETASIMDGLYVPYEIIVVNDGSSDKTGMIASAYKATVLSNGRNRGKGYSLRHALKIAQGDIIVTMDADGEHKPKEIPDLLKPLYNGTDIVAGSRFLCQNAYVTTKLNQIGNLFFNVAIMSLTGKKVTDSQTGFRAIKREVLEMLNLESDGYEIETEITVKSLRNGFVLQEKPVCVERRKHGQSKIKLLRDGKRIFRAILKASFARINTSAQRCV